MVECRCGHVARSMDHFVDHVSDEHHIIVAGVETFLEDD